MFELTKNTTMIFKIKELSSSKMFFIGTLSLVEYPLMYKKTSCIFYILHNWLPRGFMVTSLYPIAFHALLDLIEFGRLCVFTQYFWEFSRMISNKKY